MMKNRSGFTIVEVTIVVAIIAILATISIVMYSKVQIDTRNTDRSTKVNIITGALEKYFNKNGEYPSCSAMTQSAAQVSASVLPGIDPGALVTPTTASGVSNAITCTGLTAGSGPDTFAYVGDGSGTCNTGTACLKYTLQYRKEGTGEIISKQSLHTTALGSSSVPVLTATSAGTTAVNLSWTNIPGALQYRFERATDTDFTANVVATTTTNISASVTGLTTGVTYYFHVLAIASGSESDWSNTASVASVVAPPNSTPIVSAAMSGTNAVGTIGAVTCSAGTVQYQIRTRNTATATMGSWSAWSAWGTGLTQTVAASQGYQYGFQAHARCLVGTNGSGSTADSNIPVTVRTIATPAAPSWVTPAYFNSNVHAVVNYSGVCPSGTSKTNTTFHSKAWTGLTAGPHPWGYNDSWENASSVNKNVEYWGKYQCKSNWTTSAYSSEYYNVIVVRP
jgi:prepilin-type N-terminal cleavage/methylation domain-containing protein